MSRPHARPRAARRARVMARDAARLALLPYDVLLELASTALSNPEFRRTANALMAQHTPLPEWAVSDVLLSPDLAMHLLSTVEVRDHAVAAVCSVWCAAWRAKVARIVRPAPEPRVFTRFRAELQLHDRIVGGWWLGRVEQGRILRLYGHNGRRRSIRAENVIEGIAATPDQVYLCQITSTSSESCSSKLQCFDVRPSRVVSAAVERQVEGFEITDVALSPCGLLLFAVCINEDGVVLAAFDATTLELKYEFGRSLMDGFHSVIAVAHNELFAASHRLNPGQRPIRVFTLGGEHVRCLTGPWRRAADLLFVRDRLYLIESREVESQQLFVLSPLGDTLQVVDVGLGFFSLHLFADSRLVLATPLERHADDDEAQRSHALRVFQGVI